MNKLHPLDHLCLVSRVRYATNFTTTMTIPVCRDLEHLCQELYRTATKYMQETEPRPDKTVSWWFTIEISDDPTVVPLRLTMQIPGEVFCERDAEHIVVPCLMRTMRDVYDGHYGLDKVHTGGAPLASWEDLI